jgi:DNA-binding PadR family transcriptional regulator
MNEEKFAEAFIRAFSKPLILWLICHKPMHGYNLIKEFKIITGKRLKPAVIYPFLHALEEKGYVVGIWMTRGKRKIKSYSITQKGKRLLSSVRNRFKMPIGDIILALLSGDREKVEGRIIKQ